MLFAGLHMAGFRTGQAGQLPRGLHNQGASICLVTFYFGGFSGRMGLHSSTTEGCPGDSTCLNPGLGQQHIVGSNLANVIETLFGYDDVYYNNDVNGSSY